MARLTLTNGVVLTINEPVKDLVKLWSEGMRNQVPWTFNDDDGVVSVNPLQVVTIRARGEHRSQDPSPVTCPECGAPEPSESWRARGTSAW